MARKIEINPEFVDFDFSKRRPKGMGLGFRGMGRKSALFGYFSTTYTAMSRSAIIAEAEKLVDNPKAYNCNLVVEVKNQKNEGSCVGNASTQGLQVILARRYGKKLATVLSAICTYKQIGSSANSGAMVDDSMTALMNVGTLPLDTPTNRAKFGDQVMPATGFSTKFPANWKETAKRFRAGEVKVVRGFLELLTALLLGHAVVVGREGHSILYLDVIYKNGKLYVLYVNSWGEWGIAAGDFDYGFGLDTESQINKSASWAYSICAPVEQE